MESHILACLQRVLLQAVFQPQADHYTRVPVQSERVAVVIPCKNEAENLRELLPQLKSVLAVLAPAATLHIIDGHSTDATREVARVHGVGIIPQRGRGYGAAIRTALTDLDTDWIVTLDADCSHPPATLKSLFSSLGQAEIIIASRYVPHGYTRMPAMRHVLSRVLNRTFRSVLSVPVRDMSSGYRAYRRAAIAPIDVDQETFAFLPEILLKAYTRGYRVKEVPFHYRPRANGRSNARVVPFGIQYLKLLVSFWVYRNSVAAADYDLRAFSSVIPLQRWWQRQRYRIISEMVGNTLAVLDVGCGSGQLLVGVPQIVGMDPQLNKLRFMRAPGRLLLRGSIFAIPFASDSFETVVCSQVIEHIPMEAALDGLVRCLAPGGTLVLGTVDYGGWQWPLIERIYGFVHPGGYADEHITHYTRDMLIDALTRRQLEVLEIRYIARAEIIIKARKPGQVEPRPMFTEASLDRALACPRDLAPLTHHEDGYRCAMCGSNYPIVDSIPDFLVPVEGA
jgi:glycosyltransferase involved in cell wall biosynthesis